MSVTMIYAQEKKADMNTKEKAQKTEEQWKQELTEEEYRVLRDCGTEPAFTGKYYNHKENGTYTCAGCGAELFTSDTKYDSGSGWPSFYAAVDKKSIKEVEDNSYGMRRIEIKCAACDSHLGHVFPDGPKPTGMRYCVNSVSLDFEKAE
jgi:peptide-methionine (R)-S-oxide reductase